MRCGHAKCLQDCRERIQTPGKLGDAMLHEAVPDDQSQWDRRPAGDWRSADQISADQINGKVAPPWRPSLDVTCRFHIQSTFSLGVISTCGWKIFRLLSSRLVDALIIQSAMHL